MVAGAAVDWTIGVGIATNVDSCNRASGGRIIQFNKGCEHTRERFVEKLRSLCSTGTGEVALEPTFLKSLLKGALKELPLSFLLGFMLVSVVLIVGLFRVSLVELGVEFNELCVEESSC